MSNNSKEGYMMWYDSSIGQWSRVFISLSDTYLSMFQNSSRFGRLLRPSIPLQGVKRVYCSVDAADAPERHVPILGILVSSSEFSDSNSGSPSPPRTGANASPPKSNNHQPRSDDVLYVFRTPEKRLMVDWWSHIRSVTVKARADTIENMVTLKSLMPPQLFGMLFRAHDEKVTSLKRREGPAVPQTVHDVSGANSTNAKRIPSMSAFCPRRGPVSATPRGGAMMVPTPVMGAVVPMASTSPLPNRRSMAPPSSTVTTVMRGAATRCEVQQRTHVDPSVTARGPLSPASSNVANRPKLLSRSKSNTPLSSKDSSPIRVGDCPSSSTTTEQQQQQRNASEDCCIESTPNSVDNAETVVAAVLTAKNANNGVALSDKENDNNNNNSVIPPVSSGLTLSSVVAPLAVTSDKDAKIKEQRALIDSLSARNIDLEIDHANMSGRVLELESTVEQLRAAVAEWRRKHKSLEQQLDVQEADFTRRLEEERSMLMNQLQGEVQQHVMMLKEKWTAKEEEYKSLLDAAAAAAPVQVAA